jgi:hypothetical protein
MQRFHELLARPQRAQRLTVGPDDFPFKAKTRCHRRGDSVRKVTLTNALRR